MGRRNLKPTTLKRMLQILNVLLIIDVILMAIALGGLGGEALGWWDVPWELSE